MTRQQRLTLMATILGSTIVFLDSTVINVALPTIARELGASAAQSSWVLLSYMLVTTALILAIGRLADIVGRERNGGPALATFQMSADSGAIIGPILAGLLIDHGSYPLAFGITGLITLLAVIPWLFARETHDVRHGAPTPDAARPVNAADVETTVAETSREG